MRIYQADTGSSQTWVAGADCTNCIKAGMKISNLHVAEGCEAYYEDVGTFTVYSSSSFTKVSLPRIEFDAEGCCLDRAVTGNNTGCMSNTSISLGGLELSSAEVLAVGGIDQTFEEEAGLMRSVTSSLGIVLY